MLAGLRNLLGEIGGSVPLFSFVIASFAFVVAYSQLGLAKQRLRFDLFDRRLKVKEAIFGLADSMINRTTNPAAKAWADFYRDAFACRFVYPADAADWIDGVYKKVYRLWFVLELDMKRETESPLRNNERLDRIHGQIMELRKSLGNLYLEAEANLNPHLSLVEPSVSRLSWEYWKAVLCGVIWKNYQPTARYEKTPLS